MTQTKIIQSLLYVETGQLQVVIKFLDAIKAAVAICHTGEIQRGRIQAKRRGFEFLGIPEQFHNAQPRTWLHDLSHFILFIGLLFYLHLSGKPENAGVSSRQQNKTQCENIERSYSKVEERKVNHKLSE